MAFGSQPRNALCTVSKEVGVDRTLSCSSIFLSEATPINQTSFRQKRYATLTSTVCPQGIKHFCSLQIQYSVCIMVHWTYRVLLENGALDSKFETIARVSTDVWLAKILNKWVWFFKNILWSCFALTLRLNCISVGVLFLLNHLRVPLTFSNVEITLPLWGLHHLNLALLGARIRGFRSLRHQMSSSHHNKVRQMYHCIDSPNNAH